MILLVNPRATRPANRRYPHSIMAVGAALTGRERWEMVDGNRQGVSPFDDVVAHATRAEGGADPVRAVALTVMPGPQLLQAVPLSRQI